MSETEQNKSEKPKAPEITPPQAGVDKDGYIWLRIHLTHGIIFVIGFIHHQFIPWVKQMYVEQKIGKEKKSGLINPFAKRPRVN